MKNHISVLLALKDFSPTALEAVKGFLNQTVKPIELIVVGPKNDLQLLQRGLPVKTSNRIKLIKFVGEKNDARNIGFLKASGDYILYADDDMIPKNNLLEKCRQKLKRFDTLIIPERGLENMGFMASIHNLEKEIVKEDENALTPRLFKKSLFKNEKPFDPKFGILDEWGFYAKLKTKNPKIGIVNSSFTVIENQSLFERIKKSYQKGLWIKNLYEENKEEALRRVNPINRGIKIYTRNFKYFKIEPILFSMLLIVKFLEVPAFFAGYAVSLTKKYEN